MARIRLENSKFHATTRLSYPFKKPRHSLNVGAFIGGRLLNNRQGPILGHTHPVKTEDDQHPHRYGED
jgi:hypothetical protein